MYYKQKNTPILIEAFPQLARVNGRVLFVVRSSAAKKKAERS